MKVGRALALFVLIAAWRVPCGWAGEAAPLGRFDYLPYPVSVSVAFCRGSEITQAFRQHGLLGAGERGSNRRSGRCGFSVRGQRRAESTTGCHRRMSRGSTI